MESCDEPRSFGVDWISVQCLHCWALLQVASGRDKSLPLVVATVKCWRCDRDVQTWVHEEPEMCPCS